MKPKPTKQRPTWYYPVFGILALIFIVRMFGKVIDHIDERDNAPKLAKLKELRAEKNDIRNYAATLNFQDSGIEFLKYDNKPYPFFYVSVRDSTVLREDALVSILERLFLENNIGEQVDLKNGYFSAGEEAPAEVRYVLNKDIEHVVAERVFTLKKGPYSNGFVFEERRQQ